MCDKAFNDAPCVLPDGHEPPKIGDDIGTLIHEDAEGRRWIDSASDKVVETPDPGLGFGGYAGSGISELEPIDD